MPIEKTKHNCSGCTACYNVCPVSCISMEEDALGFKYPKVDLKKCIKCELCVKKCPFDDNYSTPNNFDNPIAYAAKSKSPVEVAHSQSGAAFAVLSDIIIENGGVVYGVGYADKFKVTTKRATNKQERNEFRGSKYVQSDLGNIFQAVKADLTNNRIVLFSGTPCQISGLTSFIPQKLHKNLITIDLICHGVPSPKIWANYISYLEKKEGSTIENVNFRDKSLKGWHSHVESFKFIGKSKPLYTDTYTYLFYSHIDLRYSCGNCPYTNLRRTGDITIGDCWGIEKSDAAKLGVDNKGCSLILINTPKGENLFKSIQSLMLYKKVDINDVLQPQLHEPSKISPLRKEFEEDYIRYGFKYIKRVYGPPRRIYIKNCIKKYIPKSFIKNIKQLFK